MIKVKRLTNMDDDDHHQVNDMIEIAEDDIDALLVRLNEDSLNDIEVEEEEEEEEEENKSISKHLAVVVFFETE